MHAHDVIGWLERDWKIDPPQRLVAARGIVLIDGGWFFREGARAVQVYFAEMKLQGFFRESNHCGHMVRRAAGVMDDLHVRGGVHRDVSMAILEFWYCQKGDPTKEHAVLMGVTDGAGTGSPIKPLFMEVQRVVRGESGDLGMLSEAERISCTGLRF